ncbi:MAG: HEAT repeat domain-containing protein [Nitrososphaerota archaeon]
MSRAVIIIVVVLLCAVGIFLALNYLSIPLITQQSTSTMTTITPPITTETTTKTTTPLTTTSWEKPQVNIEYLEKIHNSLDPESIPELKDIILNHPDNYVRERAVFILTDIAIRSNKVDEVIDFLKQIAYNEENDEVRTAAYANLDLIRKYYPVELGESIEIRIEGEIKKGNNVTLIVIVSTQKDIPQAVVGIKRIVNMTAGAQTPVITMLRSMNPVWLSIRAETPEKATFIIYLESEGEYLVPCVLKLNIDRSDYKIIEKFVYLKVGKDEGAYIVADNLDALITEITSTTTTST